MTSEDRIFEKLDSLEAKTTDVLVGLARLEERVNDVPDLKQRVSSLERWKWTTMGALGMSGASIASQLYNTLRGA